MSTAGVSYLLLLWLELRCYDVYLSHVLAHEPLVEIRAQKVLCRVSNPTLSDAADTIGTHIDEFLGLPLVFRSPGLVLENHVIIPSVISWLACQP